MPCPLPFPATYAYSCGALPNATHGCAGINERGRYLCAIILLNDQNPAVLMSVRDMLLKKAWTVATRASCGLELFLAGRDHYSSAHLRDPDFRAWGHGPWLKKSAEVNTSCSMEEVLRA